MYLNSTDIQIQLSANNSNNNKTYAHLKYRVNHTKNIVNKFPKQVFDIYIKESSLIETLLLLNIY